MGLGETIQEETKITMKSGFWDDPNQARRVMVDLDANKALVAQYEGLVQAFEDTREMVDLLSDDEFFAEQKDLSKEVAGLERRVGRLRTQALLSGPYDRNNCYFSIHAGSGGMEATDWAEILQRMYERWFESRGWSFELTAINKEDGGGIKSVDYFVTGPFAYGYSKSEKGVHRLVRISPFDTQGRRHTSFASVDVYPEIPDVSTIEIDEKDLKIDTYRSSGKGGQHVNTTDSAVRITHLPTGVVVTCQNERSQIQNREKAYEELVAKLVQIKEEEHREEIADIQGKYTQISWGAQIRSYIFQPYQLVKDHRTDYETGQVDRVINGQLDDFVDAYLNWQAQKEE